MAIQYHVYQNDGVGGPVDYSTPVGTTAALSHALGPLVSGGSYKFAVRSYETTTGAEEKNVDAVVSVILSPGGIDITARPNAPTGLAVVATSGGGSRVSWSYPMTTAQNRPVGFHVYRGTPTVSYATPVGAVAYVPNWGTYRFDDSGLTNGVTYQYGVRAYNATAEESNAVTVSVVADSSPPGAVENLTVSSV